MLYLTYDKNDQLRLKKMRSVTRQHKTTKKQGLETTTR